MTTSPGVPMTADSTDRDDLLEIIDEARRRVWDSRVWEEIADALIADGWMRATGPARDEGLREALVEVERLLFAATQTGDAALKGVGAEQALITARGALNRDRSPGVRAALAASPAPGGDTAPREDDEPETLVPNRLLALLVGADHCEHAADYCCHDCMTKAMDYGLSLLEAARPVPPGPAATRDGEGG